VTGRPTTHFIARLSGLPWQAVDALRSAALGHALVLQEQASREHNDLREAVSAALHLAISSITLKPERNRLLQLRRDLFNGKLPSPERLATACAALDEATKRVVDEYCDDLRHRERSLTSFRDLYSSELRDRREAFQLAIGDSDFLKGLLESSNTLFQNVRKYQTATDFGSREEQIERGLLRYFTRAAAKATPFATFCSVVAGEFRETSSGRPELHGASAAKRSFVRLNKTTYGLLWGYLRSRPKVRLAMTVEVNPTSRIHDGSVRFLASLAGTEVFQRLPLNDALALILGLDIVRTGTSLGNLAAAVATQPELDTTVEEATAYLESLIAMELLRVRSVVGEQEADWDIPLRNFLLTVDDESARSVAVMLGDLRGDVEAFAVASVAERVQCVARMRATLATGLKALGIDNKSASTLPVFEDASLEATMRIPLTSDLEETLTTLRNLGRELGRISGLRTDLATLRHFYVKKYGSRVGVPLLDFYEDYYRDHFKGHLEKERKANRSKADADLNGYDVKNPFGVPAIATIYEARQRFAATVRDAWRRNPSGEEISISSALLRKALAKTGAVPERFESLSCFGQVMFDPSSGNTRIVMTHPTFFPGFGKYFSRFLYTLPDHVCEDVRSANARLTPQVLAEIGGDSYFNGNLHPPMLPFLISHPSGDVAGGSATIPVSDLEVVPDPLDEMAVALVRRLDGRRVYPIDLGFLSMMRRTPLFQLLAQFAPSQGMGLPIPQALSSPTARSPEAGETEAPRVMVRPRIVVDERIIIARRRWWVPGVLFPAATRSETPADLFIRVDRWRRGHGIPERAYVRVLVNRQPPVAAPPAGEGPAGGHVPSGSAATIRPAVGAAIGARAEIENEPERGDRPVDPRSDAPMAEASGPVVGGAGAGVHPSLPTPRARPSRDLLKPQYIDFTSPQLVALFARMAAGLTSYDVAVEECYPGPEHLPLLGVEQFATELVLQLDVPDSADESAKHAG
jgi:hypothetical protein